MKNLRISILTTMILALLLGCKKNKEEEVEMAYGTMQVRMTDAPAAYLEVNVEIERVEVNYVNDTSAWLELETNSGVYNLLDLQGGVSTIIANESELKTGAISQMRLILGQNNYVKMEDSSTVSLETSSHTQTGLKLNINAELKAEGEIDVLIDFDAEKSIVVEGTGNLRLEPVITVVSVEVN